MWSSQKCLLRDKRYYLVESNVFWQAKDPIGRPSWSVWWYNFIWSGKEEEGGASNTGSIENLGASGSGKLWNENEIEAVPDAIESDQSTSDNGDDSVGSDDVIEVAGNRSIEDQRRTAPIVKTVEEEEEEENNNNIEEEEDDEPIVPTKRTTR